MGFQFSDAHTDQYRRDGYCKAEGLFSPDEVKELGAEMDWIIEEWWGEESIGWRDTTCPTASSAKPAPYFWAIRNSTQRPGAG